MRHLITFIIAFLMWGAAVGFFTMRFDPMHKLAHTKKDAIPDMGKSAQDILDMKLALYFSNPRPKIIIGNSRPYKGLPAEAFGEEWFNFSIPGANALDLAALIKFLTQCQKTQNISETMLTLDLNVYDVSRGEKTGQNFNIERHKRKCAASSALQSIWTDALTHPTYLIDINNIYKTVKLQSTSYTRQGSFLGFPEKLTSRQIYNASISKLQDYEANGWGALGNDDDISRLSAIYHTALSAFNDISSRLSAHNIDLKLVWTPIHASLYRLKVQKGLDNLYRELQLKTAQIVIDNNGHILAPDLSDLTIQPLEQKNTHEFYFYDPSHYTSSIGTKIVHKLRETEEVKDIETLQQILENQHEYIMRPQHLPPILKAKALHQQP